MIMVIIKNLKTTKADQRYFDEKAKIKKAAEEGRLGRDWYTKNPKTGKHELRPKKIFDRV